MIGPKGATWMLAVIIAAMLVLAFWIIFVKNGWSVEVISQTELNPERIYCHTKWCLIHEDVIADTIRETAFEVCEWVN